MSFPKFIAAFFFVSLYLMVKYQVLSTIESIQSALSYIKSIQLWVSIHSIGILNINHKSRKSNPQLGEGSL